MTHRIVKPPQQYTDFHQFDAISRRLMQDCHIMAAALQNQGHEPRTKRDIAEWVTSSTTLVNEAHQKLLAHITTVHQRLIDGTYRNEQ